MSVLLWGLGGYMKASKIVALIGNPNCGKTSLFNLLTGSQQRVANFAGVTVDRYEGFFTEQDQTIELVDLPGIYSRLMTCDMASVDERITCETLLTQHFDIIINVIDATNIARHL